jgi:hypothetical protein
VQQFVQRLAPLVDAFKLSTRQAHNTLTQLFVDGTACHWKALDVARYVCAPPRPACCSRAPFARTPPWVLPTLSADVQLPFPPLV